MTRAPFSITIYDKSVGEDVLQQVAALYRRVFIEPPYVEGEQEFADFTEDLPRRVEQASFRLVIARSGVEPLGFAMGHQLPSNTKWWEGALTSFPPEIASEHPCRTFAIIELAVLQFSRKMHIGERLHTHLIAGLREERVTLLVRPDASAAQAAYSRWGYRHVGQIRPVQSAPIYDSLISPDRSSELPAGSESR